MMVGRSVGLKDARAAQRLFLVTAFLGLAPRSPVSASPRVPSPWKIVAGTGKSGFGGNTYERLNHGFSVETRLSSPWGVAHHASADLLYVADSSNDVVRSVSLTTGLIETIAGTGDPGFSGDSAAAVLARFRSPTALALDDVYGVLYVSDTGNHVVRAIGLRAGVTYQAEEPTVASSRVASQVRSVCPGPAPANETVLLLGSAYCAGTTGSGYADYTQAIQDYIEFKVLATDGPGAYELRFRYADRHGFTSADGGRLMRLLVDGVVVTHDLHFRPTGPSQAGRRDVFEWNAITVNLALGNNMIRLEVTGHGGPLIDLLYVQLASRPTIWRIAGIGAPGAADDLQTPQTAVSSPLHSPLGLAVDVTGQRLYVADSDNRRVRRVLLSGAKTIETIAGGRVLGSSRDGEQAREGALFRPTGLALDSAREYLYILDAEQHRLRRLDLTNRMQIGGTIITVAGFGSRQANFDLLLKAPQDVVLNEAAGVIYVSDRDNDRIRVVNMSKGLCPQPEVSRLECAHEGVSPADCTALGCCYDAAHTDCASPLNQDGRRHGVGNFTPLDVMTKLDGKEAASPISFVTERSRRCCYPKLLETRSLELLDRPQGLAFDAAAGELYASQPRSHRVVRLTLGHGRCFGGAMQC